MSVGWSGVGVVSGADEENFFANQVLGIWRSGVMAPGTCRHTPVARFPGVGRNLNSCDFRAPGLFPRTLRNADHLLLGSSPHGSRTGLVACPLPPGVAVWGDAGQVRELLFQLLLASPMSASASV